MADTARARPGGRTARVRAAVLDATVAELAEHGYAELTVEAVAARAGVNKTTLYRRWGGKNGLLVDAVEAFGAGQAEVPDTGQVDEDLRRWARSIVTTLTAPASGAVIRALFNGAGDSPQVRHLRHRFWLARSTLVLPMVERAIERGQLPPGTDALEVIRHVGAPLYYRLLVLAEPPTAEAADLAAAVTLAAARAGVFVAAPRASPDAVQESRR
ncbi:MAG TPA: TetR/AcrR family transcriptional regulator [Actinomycetes bacterium]|jgi:AcrR family transcriptional regulator|nr:TetR/AcrR family transcriptional regulator [Actinomycetes bacterium]HEX2159126.1 TetR/AcrR family transcriptional regulator [Actinomycetes bacterium]